MVSISAVHGNALLSGGYLDYSNFLFEIKQEEEEMELTTRRNTYDYFIDNVGNYLKEHVEVIDIPLSLMI